MEEREVSERRAQAGIAHMHGVARLDVKEHAECEHRDAEDDAEEDQVVAALRQDRCHQAHLGHDHIREFDDLEQLDAHTD